MPAGWSRWLELRHHLHNRISQERLMNLRLSGPCQPLGEGGQSFAYTLHARLSALGAHTYILWYFGKALAACSAMRARMAWSHSAHCRRRDCTALIPTINLTLPRWEATQLPGRRFVSSVGPQAVRRLRRLQEVRCLLRSLKPSAPAACVPLLCACLSGPLEP